MPKKYSILTIFHSTLGSQRWEANSRSLIKDNLHRVRNHMARNNHESRQDFFCKIVLIT
jgi:hypothetical protein